MAEDLTKQSLGKRIKSLRENRHLDLETLAEEVGQPVEYLEMVEQGRVRPPVALLLTLSRVLKVDSVILLQEGEEDEAAASPQQHEALRKRADNYSYELLAPELLQKFLKSFLVSIEPNSDLEGAGYQHDGEEFHYVLKGRVRVTVGDKTYELGPGQALYFNSKQNHTLTNIGQETCELLVVLYTP